MKRGPYRKASLVDRLRRRSIIEGACWLWQGCTLAHFPYGQVTSNGKTLLVHRVAYEQLVGPIPASMNVLHRCDNGRCWNPAHLFIGTHADNIADKVKKGRQRLVHSHPDVKLQEADVPLAAQLHATGHSWSRLAERFGVSHDLVRVRCARAALFQF